MARAKEFDREEALDKAMNVFWSKGYEATSMADLLDAMGIGRQSLYDTFGDKHDLFLEALARYEELRGAPLRSCFDSAASVRGAFQDLFMGFVRETEAQQRRGCFSVNTAAELAALDPKAAKVVQASQRGLEALFFKALSRAQRDGELPASKDPRALARFLVGALQGLRLTAKADPRSPALRDIARITLAALD
ncbi:MAG: Transcriptional regulator, TetR family protein [Myxococcaceae bacterium]|nr:Transcriptional regulator, TetR family protein [Myxococcaceae bacterium]